MNDLIKRGSKVLVDGKTAIISHIQPEHNRYQLQGVSGWQYGVDRLQLMSDEQLITMLQQYHEALIAVEEDLKEWHSELGSCWGCVTCEENLPLIKKLLGAREGEPHE